MEVAKAKRYPESEQWELYEIGEKLRRARTEAGLNQNQLADKIDCDRATISHYENGTGGYMGQATLLRICEALSIEPNELSPDKYIKQDKRTEASKENAAHEKGEEGEDCGEIIGSEKELIELIRMLPKDKREILLPGLKAMISTYL